MFKLNRFTFLIFFFLFLYSLSFWVVKEFFGVGIYYHPDSLHYIRDSAVISTDLFTGDTSFNGKLFYLYTYFLDSNVYLIIILNIIYYSFTGLLFYNALNLSCYRNNSKSITLRLFILVYVCDLYMLHISSTPLKESISYLLV
jgi:hypothetical protein